MTIHKLTARLLPGEADAELVEAIEELLAEAKRGEIAGLAWAGTAPNGEVFQAWAGGDDTLYSLAAGIMTLQTRYSLMLMDPDE